MTDSNVQNAEQIAAQTLERVLIQGDLSSLTPDQKVSYMMSVCKSVGLNHLTKPFEFIRLNGKEVLYAKRDATDQLRKVHKISITVKNRELIGDVYVVTARALGADHREDESTGAVPVKGLGGEQLANAYMKAETKAKRRVTLSICGLGILDETEVESISPSLKRIVMEQPGPGDGVIDHHEGTYYVPKGTWSRRKVTDIPIDECRKEIERLENIPSLEHWQMTFLDRLKEYIASVDSMEPASVTAGERIKCPCGNDLKYSDRKNVYYCPDYKNEAIKHIFPVNKEDYEK